MLCAVCQKKTTTYCAVCKYVHYCSRDCQKLDWKSHKKFCNSIVVKEKEEEGKVGLKFTRRSVFAAKDLDRGSYILEEFPLFQIARGPEEGEKKKDLIFCVTCGTNLSEFLNARCSKCHWPACVQVGKNCEKHKIHADYECGILASKKIDYNSLAVDEKRRILLVLRAQAIKEKNVDLWDELMKRADEISTAGQDLDFNREEISKLEETMKKLGADEILASGQDSVINPEEVLKLKESMKKLDISNENIVRDLQRVNKTHVVHWQ